MKIRDVVKPRRKGAKIRASRARKLSALERRRRDTRHAAIKRATWDRIATDANGQKWITGPVPFPLI